MSAPDRQRREYFFAHKLLCPLISPPHPYDSPPLILVTSLQSTRENRDQSGQAIYVSIGQHNRTEVYHGTITPLSSSHTRVLLSTSTLSLYVNHMHASPIMVMSLCDAPIEAPHINKIK